MKSLAVQRIQVVLMLEAGMFILAALARFGIHGHTSVDFTTGVAESILALIVLSALALGVSRPVASVDIALAAQIVALLAQVVGMLGLLAGAYLGDAAGPQATVGIIYRAAMIAVLIGGVCLTWQAPYAAGSRS
jgi:hypothetical protein